MQAKLDIIAEILLAEILLAGILLVIQVEFNIIAGILLTAEPRPQG